MQGLLAAYSPRIHATGGWKDHFPDDPVRVFGKVLINRSGLCPAFLEIIHLNFYCFRPVWPQAVLSAVFLEEHNVGGDFSEGVLFESMIRQAHRAQEVGMLRDMFPGRGVNGVHEKTGHHKGGHASFP